MRNKKTLIVLLLLLIAAAYFYFNKGTSTLGEAYTDFAIKDTSEVSRIFISTQANSKADLERNDDGSWTINGKFTARKDGIDLLLETFYRIDVKSPVPQSAFENVVKRLASTGIKVEIYMDGEDEPEKTYYVGQATANHHGTYMLLELDGKKSPRPVITYVPGFYGYLSTRFFTEERLWRDRAIFHISPENVKELSVAYPLEPEKSFIIRQENGEFEVSKADGQPISGLDRASVNDYLGRYRSVHFEYLEIDTPKEMKDSILNSIPMNIVELTDSEGRKRSLETFYKPVNDGSYDINTGEPLSHNLDRCFGMIDGKDFVTIQYITLDDLLITASDMEKTARVNK